MDLMDSDRFDGEWTICPYCDAKHGDSFEYNNSSTPNKTTCDSCGKTFLQWAEYDVTYCTSRIDEQ